MSKTATQAEVKIAYKKMAAVVHPDKGGSAMLFRLVQEAYEVLSDPAKRKQHDADLVGPAGGNHLAGSQNTRQRSYSAQPETDYTNVEDAYKRWKDNRDRGAMLRSESIAAGGVRKMVRESMPFFYMNDQIGATGSASCSNCGYGTGTFEDRQFKPLICRDIKSKRDYVSGDIVGICERCKEPRGYLREVNWAWSERKWMQEPISIDSGDLLLFCNLKYFSERFSFGYVIDGSARDERGLRILKVLDEYSGQLLSPQDWKFVFGHWKSNDLSKNRTGSMRNWTV